jgi:ADP-ribose pyrophosphatase YjhB (NUDIX family)
MSLYPNTFYRVSVKAFITNDRGQVLVVKENQDTWSLPGGGLDHGEDPLAGVARELKEELGITDASSLEPFCVKTFYLEHKEAWLLWVVFKAQIPNDKFILGEGVTEAVFIDPADLADSQDVFEKLVYAVAKEL